MTIFLLGIALIIMVNPFSFRSSNLLDCPAKKSYLNSIKNIWYLLTLLVYSKATSKEMKRVF